MASYYVYSGAGGAGTGADWANAYTTLATAYSGKASGDIFYVAHDHNESTAGAVTLTGTDFFVYCVNRAGSVPPVSADLMTTGAVSTTGNSAITIQGTAYYYGIIFTAGSGANAPALVVGGNGGRNILENCALRSGGASNSIIRYGFNSSAVVDLINTTIQFSATGSAIQASAGYTRWRGNGSSITGATLPTTLVTGYGTAGMFWEGIDLSVLGSGKTLFGNQGSTGNIVLKDCKLGSSVTVAASMGSVGSPRIDVIRSDSGATNYINSRFWFQGAQTTETTIVRTGGATDGTTPISWKLVTGANSRWTAPFESQPIVIWNESLSAVTTLTIYGTTTGGGVPNNDNIWVEVEYPGSGSFPLGAYITTTKADNLAASGTTNNSSDSSTWGGGGAGNGFKIVVPSFTPAMKGPLSIVVKAAKASSTYYIDPKPGI
jgi:hypothetical protein